MIGATLSLTHTYQEAKSYTILIRAYAVDASEDVDPAYILNTQFLANINVLEAGDSAESSSSQESSESSSSQKSSAQSASSESSLGVVCPLIQSAINNGLGELCP